MGTANEWMKVALAAVLWALLMLFFTAPDRKRKGYTPATSGEDVAMWACAGFGLITIFGWQRAFHVPLIFQTLGTFIASYIFERLRRRKHASQERPEGLDIRVGRVSLRRAQAASANSCRSGLACPPLLEATARATGWTRWSTPTSGG